MTTIWHNLYLHTNKAQKLITAIETELTELGYTIYNPFGAMPSKSYTNTIRVFVTPPSENTWTRILGNFDVRLLPSLSHIAPCLSLAMNTDSADIQFFANGDMKDTQTALIPHLKSRYTEQDLHKVLNGNFASNASTNDDSFPMNLLPPDLQEGAKSLNSKHINKMFNKLMGKVNKKLGDDNAESAKALLQAKVDWNTPSALKIRALMNILTISDDWHTPNFVTLRDAYQLHQRKQRNPNAILYPGDSEALQAVPNALDYKPVYGGKNE